MHLCEKRTNLLRWKADLRHEEYITSVVRRPKVDTCREKWSQHGKVFLALLHKQILSSKNQRMGNASMALQSSNKSREGSRRGYPDRFTGP